MSALLKWLNAHKTKLLGFCLVILGALQANMEALRDVMSVRAFAWLVVGLGMGVAAVGFINTQLLGSRDDE